jgi:hypothetical protein
MQKQFKIIVEFEPYTPDEENYPVHKDNIELMAQMDLEFFDFEMYSERNFKTFIDILDKNGKFIKRIEKA